MYCPKCGSEIKDGSLFCPKCGAKMADRTQKTDSPKISLDKIHIPNKPVSINVNTEMISNLWKKHKSLLAVCAVFLIAVMLISKSWNPILPALDAEAVMEEYLEENVQYRNNKELYQKCFAYEAKDLTDQISKHLESMFSMIGLNRTSGDVSNSKISEMKDSIIEYFSQRPENQEALVREITKYSDVYIENQKRKGKKIKADITVRFLDVTAVNQSILENSMNAQTILGLLIRENYFGPAIQIATGDVSFVLNKFIEEAERSDARNVYKGTVEFSYDKKEGCWKVDKLDKQVMNAYFGIR